MKTPDEIKMGLECCFNEDHLDFVCGECPYDEAGSECGNLFGDALAYIELLESELDNVRLSFAQQSREVEEYKLELLKQVKNTIDQLPRWISVNEQLPKEFATVLIMRDDIKQACVGWLIGGCWSVPKEVRVTHWMPLPSTEGLNDN